MILVHSSMDMDQNRLKICGQESPGPLVEFDFGRHALIYYVTNCKPHIFIINPDRLFNWETDHFVASDYHIINDQSYINHHKLSVPIINHI